MVMGWRVADVGARRLMCIVNFGRAGSVSYSCSLSPSLPIPGWLDRGALRRGLLARGAEVSTPPGSPGNQAYYLTTTCAACHLPEGN